MSKNVDKISKANVCVPSNISLIGYEDTINSVFSTKILVQRQIIVEKVQRRLRFSPEYNCHDK